MSPRIAYALSNESGITVPQLMFFIFPQSSIYLQFFASSRFFIKNVNYICQ
jgi:hypothetical protein